LSFTEYYVRVIGLFVINPDWSQKYPYLSEIMLFLCLELL